MAGLTNQTTPREKRKLSLYGSDQRYCLTTPKAVLNPRGGINGCLSNWIALRPASTFKLRKKKVEVTYGEQYSTDLL